MANPYSLLHGGNSLTFKTWDDWGHISPNFEYSEGIRPTGQFMPAPYLPSIRFNVYFEEYFVLSGGKVVAFDSNGDVVPAGLRKQAANYLAAFDAGGGAGGTGAADAEAVSDLTRYTATDVARGINNAAGDPVTDGEAVVESFFDLTGNSGVQQVFISNPIGISMYNYWAHPGGDGTNPAQYNTYNFNLQHRVAFVTDYVLQLPAVEDQATYDAAPFAGMGAVLSADGTLSPGMLVTYDEYSNMIPTGAGDAGYEQGAIDGAEILGQILEVDTTFPKDLLEKVRTRHTELGELEKMPGTATEGKPDQLTYSGGYGLVTINLTTR